jgi:predicted RND superfamily exporter protein
VLGGLVVVVLVAGLGFRNLSTDPSLLSYFDPDGPLYEGLEAIDRDGGSSPLNIVIRDPGGMAIGDAETVEKMWTLHESLESDPAVGSLISPALLLNEARRVPMAGFLSNALLLDLLQGPFFGRVGLSYVTADHMEGRFFLRMREGGRVESRQVVLDRIERYVTDAELEPVYVAGQYELQLQLGRLIRSSLAIGLGGLLMLFVGVAAVVSRDRWTTLVMVLCLTSIPIVVLGVMGHLAMPVDIIASPAANVALAMGVDSMIHLVMRVRKLGNGNMADPATWIQARRELWHPIVGAAAIISVGFGIFGLSSFPPTQRFGIAVIVGTLMAASLTLIAVPRGATLRRAKSS